MSNKYYEYETLEGDTWDSIALDFYNNEFKATDIMKINPEHVKTIVFQAGIILKIPIIEEERISSTLPPWKR